MIRRATEDDIPTVLNLLYLLLEWQNHGDSFVATNEGLSEALFSDPPQAYCDVMEINGEIIGVALWYPTYSVYMSEMGIRLEDLFIKPEYRGKGYGKALMVHLARMCIDKGWQRFEWEVFDFNSSAITFYDALDAESTPDLISRGLYGEKLAEVAAQADAQ